MVAFSLCGAAGLLLTLVSTALLATGGVLTEFVDVFIVVDPDDPDNTEPLAGVGIFKAVYDSSVLSDEQLEASGVPEDSFETPTLNFPLLFPFQEHFVLDVLPIVSDDVASLGDTAVAGVDAAVAFVEAVEFTDCETYTSEIFPAMTSYWTTLEAAIFPAAIQLFDATVRAGVDEVLAEAFDGISGTNMSDVVLGGTQSLAGLAVLALSSVDCASFSFTDTTSNLEGCFNDINTLLANTPGAENLNIANYFIDTCDDDDTVVGCILVSTSFDLQDGGIDDDIVFTEEDGQIGNACDVLLGALCDISTVGTYRTYITTIATVAETLGDTSTSDALGTFLNISQFFADGTILNLDVADTADFAVPDAADLLTADYEPCATLAAAGLSESDTCTFLEYMPLATQALIDDGNALAGVFAGVSDLYVETCINLLGVATLAGEDFDGCPEAFGRVVIDGALQGDLSEDEEEDFLGLAIESVGLARGQAACEENDVDNEKIASSQTLIIVAYVSHAIAILSGIAGLMTDAKTATFAVAGVTAVVGGFMTFGALLLVQSAPVYDGVGGEAEEGDAFFQSGVVVTLGLSDFVIMVVGGICFLVAAYYASRADVGEAAEEDEKKEEAIAAKAAEPEEELEAAEVKAEEASKEDKEEDKVPGTNVAI